MNKRKVAITLTVIAIFLFVLIYGLLDPATVPFPRCPFNLITGLKCPGCGSQRALHQLLHLNIAQAFSYNACMVAFVPVISFLAFARIMRSRFPRLYAASHNTVFSWTLLAIILLWFLIRNIFGW